MIKNKGLLAQIEESKDFNYNELTGEKFKEILKDLCWSTEEKQQELNNLKFHICNKSKLKVLLKQLGINE